MSRPSEFTNVVADIICDRLADGESLRKICLDDALPSKATVFRWLASEDYKEFRDQYVRAREAQADALADEILDISDDGSKDTYTDDNGVVRVDQEALGRSRLRVDARKWLAGKMAPKKYGDKVETTLRGAGENGSHLVDATIEIKLVRPNAG